MSDLIKRSDAIKAVEEWAVNLGNPKMLVREDAILVLKSMPSAERQGEWIPCSERMPEEREWIGTKKFGTTISDEVLVTFEVRGERFVKPMHFQNGELGGMDKHSMDAVYGEWGVVAWMPLPEPYGEREGE